MTVMTSRERTASVLLTLCAMLGAALLFSSELIVGRIITPLYGGASSVWLLCLMLYQVLLLLGYAYAHAFGRRLGKGHLVLALLPTINLPLNMSTTLTHAHPSVEIVLNLCRHIALPFILLSTTAVITQLYWQRSSLGKKQPPWKLYAASNAGSLVALLGYPTLIEPLTTLTTQRMVWSAGWVIYLALLIAAYFAAKPDMSPSAAHATTTPKPRGAQQLRWVLLSAIPSAMLVVASSVLGSEIGSFPLLWTAPLTLYILTFILIFSDRGQKLRLLLIKLWPEISALGVALWLLMTSAWIWVIWLLLFLFILCASSHAQLYEDRPEPEHLTRFYLLMSLGGGIGGAMATLLPPILFNSMVELPLVLAAYFLVMLVIHRKDTKDYLKNAKITSVAPRLLITLLAIILSIFVRFNSELPTSLEATRNFYGIFQVVDYPQKLPDGRTVTIRKLLHGRTIHGMQTPNKEIDSPLAYYYIDGAMGQVYKLLNGPRKIAAIGLGSGAMAAHARAGDDLKFYEIDANSIYLAKKWFTFIKDSPAKISFVEGDGRTLLERDKDTYDIIHLDAFSGDGIPSHLLTVEAMQLYLDHLKPNGVILLHVSNRYYELRPLLKQMATHFKINAFYNVSDPIFYKGTNLVYHTFLVAMSRQRTSLEPLLKTSHWADLTTLAEVPKVELWTDERINLMGSLMIWLKLPKPSSESQPVKSVK